MRLKGIKLLKNEVDVAMFLVENKIPFEYKDNGDIIIERVETWDRRNKQAILVDDFIDGNFGAVGRNMNTNQLLFCNRDFTEVFGRDEFKPEQI